MPQLLEKERISAEEKALILGAFNDTQKPISDTDTAITLFEKQVALTPERIALIEGERKITYAELNCMANNLATKLRNFGVKPDSTVALICKRSTQLLAAIYGILKAGGAYVPMDPTYPKDRVDYILSDCSPVAVVCFGVHVQTELPVIDLADNSAFEGENEQPACLSGQKNLAYVIYTSGTTGRPKGVMLEHRALLNHIRIADEKYYPEKNVITPLFTSHCFDFAVPNIFVPLTNGGTLQIFEDRDDAILDVLRTPEVKIIKVTPSVMKAALDDLPRIKDRQLDTFVLGGEALSPELVRSIHNAFGENIKVYNEYGPTEAAVFCTTYLASDDADRTVPIGKPVYNSQIYIMDGMQLCGIGTVGELCIAGDCLARGYLNRPELTAEKFIDNPFGEGKLYRTGDHAKWLPDGNIDFLGRIDEQVKIRGFRIELEEIEHAVCEADDIKDCVVIVREDALGEKALYAYIVASKTIDLTELKAGLYERLPGYMVPTYMTQIDAIPVTRNGKLDKKALPKIEGTTTYVAPTDETEAKICNIFAEVLGLDAVGISERFFDIGGHSLRVIKLSNRIDRQFGVRLTQLEIFQNQTPQLLARVLRQKKGQAYEEIPLADVLDYYPMSSAQQRMYLVSQMGENNTSYNLPTAWRIEGEIDPERLKNALAKLHERHEILRTEFILREGVGVQRIVPEITPDFAYIHDEESPQERLLERFVRVFDLSKAPLVRMELICRKDHHLLLIDSHHIISDGMSAETFRKELSAIYNGKALAPLRRQYKDYSQWMAARDLLTQKNYWLEQFKDEPPVLDIQTDFKRPQKQSHRGSMLVKPLNAELCERIRSLAKLGDATEYMVFLSIGMILLSKYSRQEDVVIGSAFSGRTHSDTEAMLGMFVNTLAMRAQPKGEKTYRQFLDEIRTLCLTAYENQEYPFDHLVEALHLRREVSRNPLFDVMLVVQNNDHTHFELSGTKIERLRMADTGATFDLTFNIEEENGCYSLGLEYCTDLFERTTAQRMLDHFAAIISQIDDIDRSISSISALTETEKRQIICDFNDTDAPYPGQTIVELFEEQVQNTPSALAVTCDGKSLTYAQLNARANQIAHALRSLGVKPNDKVALLTHRSNEMIAAIYGVLKSGAAYVPIDPAYPSERIAFMLEDSAPKAVILYGAELLTDLPTIVLDADMLPEETSNPARVNVPTDLAYCIYTSGTTGKPKGVLLEHHGVANLKAYFKNRFDVGEGDHVLQFANYVFDGSVWEMNMALLNGARLVIATNKLDIPAFEKMFRDENITIASLPPNFYAQLDEISPRILITAGSAADAGIVGKASNSRYVNSYGPTECTVAATHWEFEGDLSKIPIGKPIQNAKVLIMQGETLCGIGVPGELCIGGAGLARGYLNRPELTAEKFVSNPFGNGKIYRTGDLARWLPDGNIEFLGRVDEQVKIRGFRVELGEIEAVLRKVDAISDCAVIVRKNSHGEDAIYAYLVSREEQNFESIRSELRKALPDYMIPAYMMQIDVIPVTTNGKLDKRALPEIVLRSDSEYIPPRNPAEQVLCEAFEEILDVSCVSVKDSFFDFGGDSIKAIRVVSKVRDKGFSLSVKDIMENATVEQIAMFAQEQEQNIYPQHEILGDVPDTPVIAQFKRWNLTKPEHFNQAIFLETQADAALIEKALHAIVKHHDMLRAVWENGHLRIEPYRGQLEFSVSDLRMQLRPFEAVREEANKLQASFDLEKGPLLKAVLFQTLLGNRLLICIHHLVVDGISWQILTEDLNKAISQQVSGKPIELPLKTGSFAQWAELLQEYSRTLKSEEGYWCEINEQIPENTLILQRREQTMPVCAHVSFTEEQTQKLLLDAGKAYHTQINDLLLAALSMCVYELTGQQKVAVCLEGHGRQELHRRFAVDRTIGWFTSAYPVILQCLGNIEAAIVETKETLHRIPNHGIGYGLLHPPICDTPINLYFNYLGESEQVEDFSYGECIAPENRFAGEINFNGGVRNGRLYFDVSANQATVDERTVERFAECYKEMLNSIIDFCSESEDERRTLADVDADDLEEADFDEINAILGLL